MLSKSRTENVKRNVLFGYLDTILVSFFQIICRTVFVYTIGTSYLGVSGLFSNILGILSFTELGLGPSIVFALYKPIAENDRNKVKSLLLLYKKAYRMIAIIITILGLLILPILDKLVNTEIPIEQIRLFYIICLINTISSYFVTYKTSYVSAIQKEYIVSNLNAIGEIIISITQIIILLLGGNYLNFLLAALVLGLIQKLVISIYLNIKYPIVNEKNVITLDKETKRSIWKNMKALIVHKIGDVSVHQTDNIIVSTFISTATVGLLSNYNSLINMVNMITNKLFSSFTSSIGNLIATESIEKQKQVFDVYDLLGFWIYGFVLIGFVTLSQALISLWLGSDMLIDSLSLLLLLVSQYFAGITFIPYNFKVAAGKFNEDKWVAFAQSFTNIVISIAAIKSFGLPGVFIGTILSRLIVVIVRPYIVYLHIFKSSPKEYYVRLIKRTLLAFGLCIGMSWIRMIIMPKVTFSRFVILLLLTCLIPNCVFFLIYRNTIEFEDIVSRLGRKK